MPMPETVPADAFCVPLPMTEEQRMEYRKQVDLLAEKSDFREPGSKERYKEIMYRHEGAYCVRFEDFVAGQLDAPELVLEMDGPPVIDPRRPLAKPDEDWLRDETIMFDKMKFWKPPTPAMMPKLCLCNPVVVKDYRIGSSPSGRAA